MDKIGILEDDMKMGDEIRIFLEANGYEGRCITPAEYQGFSEEQMTRFLLDEQLTLLLLDINLPGFDGIKICRSYREKCSRPVIMITSDNSELTELMSIQSGADDFVPKPFNTRILLARMENVIRRTGGSAEYSDREEISLEAGGNFSFDKMKGRIIGEKGECELSKNELHILYILIKNKGRIVARDEIINELWDNEAFVDDNTLTVNMTRLKNKLEQIGIRDAIATRRGMGYILN
ncbi:MAG: response regulator transcription factor [Lachnospiraceae bacterium]|nr:response regulator transcription factor [Lachnospiraceae bacterium]